MIPIQSWIKVVQYSLLWLTWHMMRADVRYISSIHFWHSSSWEICYMLHESCYYVKLSQVVSLFSKNIHYKFHFGLFWYGDVIIQKKVFLYELSFLVGKNLASLILSYIFWRLIELSYIFHQAVCPFLLFCFSYFIDTGILSTRK